ncbi:hypothetical protein [Catellatospora methionotrophica]|uniref:hypothetical protein n=1 Tax=Catellatospora methionotrophica TaxID=121620 RepID=UPI0033F8D3E6
MYDNPWMVERFIDVLREARADGDEATVDAMLSRAAADPVLCAALLNIGLRNALAEGDMNTVAAWFVYQAV